MRSTPSHVCAALMHQHDQLRVMMNRCEQLADDVEAGISSPDVLTREVAKLRIALDAHNKYEEQLLRPVLHELDAFADVRIERMVADHVAEHRSIHRGLAAGPTAQLRDAIDTLRVHLAGEERYFVTSKVLRDDLVVVEGSD